MDNNYNMLARIALYKSKRAEEMSQENWQKAFNQISESIDVIALEAIESGVLIKSFGDYLEYGKYEDPDKLYYG